MDAKEFVAEIKNCIKSADLHQYLGKLYGEYLANMYKENISLEDLEMISYVLRKHGKKETAEKAFVCGVYSEKFNRLKEDILDIKKEQKIISVLSSMESRNLFTFLFNNGCCKYEYIEEMVSIKNLSDILEQFVAVGLAWCTRLPTVTYFELTAAGYVYYNKTIGRWSS